MPKIRQLDRHVQNLIAAGEVVERPASVIKELVENAVDAGATAITAEIKHGGLSYIRVTDNGCGISGEDARTAFLRHATSKIQTEKDLEAVSTLGFRGEALAAVAAVSRVDLITLSRQAQTGLALTLEGGQVIDENPAGCPPGTTLIVRDLFFNTPARMKFLKRDATETAHITAAVQRAALAHPEIAFAFIKDGESEFNTPGDGVLLNCIYSVFGRGFALDLLKADAEFENIRVSGFVTKPAASRANRSMQHFFVNGRPVRSRTLSAALEEAFKNSLTVGRYPGCVLNLGIGYGLVDVNVHPAKTEIKFSNEKNAFDAVYFAVKNALEGDSGRAEFISAHPKPVFGSPDRQPTPVQSELTDLGTGVFSPAQTAPLSAVAAPKPAAADALAPVQSASIPGWPSAPDVQPELHEPVIQAYAQSETVFIPLLRGKHAPQGAQPDAPSESPADSSPYAGRDWRIVGEALETYIIVEQGQSVLLVDKHAAHERVLYERLRTADARFMSQLLIAPAVLAMSAPESGILLENSALLASLGFEIDDFGSGSLVVRACPNDIDAADVGPALSEIAEKLMENRRAPAMDKRDTLLYTVACKAAIKAGSSTTPNEREALISEVMNNPQIKFCPHGRPIVMEITKAQLERQFKRT